MSEFLAREGSPGADGSLFDPKLDLGRFLHDTPKSHLVTITPSTVRSAPHLTTQQWLAIYRLHLRADLVALLLDSSADTFESAATVGHVDDAGAERIFLPHPPGADHPITKNDAMWIIARPSSSSAAEAVAHCDMPGDHRQADSADLGAPSLDGNLFVVQSVSQDNFSLLSRPATRSTGSSVGLKGIGSVRRHRWEYEAVAEVCVAASQPLLVLADYTGEDTRPFASAGLDLSEACSNAKLTDHQTLAFRRAAKTTTHPVINLSSPAGAGKSLIVLALLRLWLVEVLSEPDSRKIACYAVSKPLLREPMLAKAAQIFGPELARHVVIAGIRDENFEYLNDAIKRATGEATSSTKAEMGQLDIEIEAKLAHNVASDLRGLLSLHAARSKVFWRWVSESKEASAAFTGDIKIVILTSAKLLKEMAPGGAGILSKRDVDVAVLDEVQQERAFTVLAIAANTRTRMLLAQDHRQRYVTSVTHYETVASTDETRGGAVIESRHCGDQPTLLRLNPILKREKVTDVTLSVVIRQGQGAINFLNVLNRGLYGDLVSNADHDTTACVIPFSTPSEWVVVAEDLPEPIRRREGERLRVYRNKTLFLALTLGAW